MNTQTVEKAIIFLVPGIDVVNGGVMSILSIAAESRRLHDVHGANVYVCTLPNHPPLSRYTRFTNNEKLLGFDQLLSQLHQCREFMLHIPEVHVSDLLSWLRLHGIVCLPNLRINILLQNIDVCPSDVELRQLGSWAPLSCTTAHLAYATAEVQARLGCPLHHLSVWVSPEHYRRVDVLEKESLLVYSNDENPRKAEVLAYLRSSLPEYSFLEITHMTHEQYKNTIARAKFSISFGEGLDGYFVEPVFSGSIGCAVYNDRFFTDDFFRTSFVYESWNDFLERFIEDVRRCEEIDAFRKVNDDQFKRLAKVYSYDTYQDNLKKFYGATFARNR